VTVVIGNVLNLKIMTLWVNNWERLHDTIFLNCFTSLNVLFPWVHGWLVGWSVIWLVFLLVRSLFDGALPAAENLLDLKVMILDLFQVHAFCVIEKKLLFNIESKWRGRKCSRYVLW
jgi:hypothetical protein